MKVERCCNKKPLYDCDCCGHEWVTCGVCGSEIEGYESESIYEEWNEFIKEG